MQYVTLGRTGLRVSRVGFGAIRLPDVEYEVAEAALNRALDLGVNFVDTARDYGDSEHKIGKALAKRRSEYYLATKTAARDAKGAQRELETSLRELGTDYIDLYQLHSVSDPALWEQVSAPGGALEAARRGVEKGTIRHLGVSVHRDLQVMRKVIESGAFETIMLAYNPLDPEGVREEILPLARERGLGVIIMKPLSGGGLTARVGESKEADALSVDCLRYVLAESSVDVVIPGIESVSEIEADVRAAERPMTDEGERRALLERIAKLGKSFRYGQVCLQCGYCLPCPEGVPIPQVMRAMMMAREYPEQQRWMGKALYQSLAVTASACVECETCLRKCPGGLPIPAKMKEAVEFFGV